MQKRSVPPLSSANWTRATVDTVSLQYKKKGPACCIQGTCCVYVHGHPPDMLGVVVRHPNNCSVLQLEGSRILCNPEAVALYWELWERQRASVRRAGRHAAQEAAEARRKAERRLDQVGPEHSTPTLPVPLSTHITSPVESVVGDSPLFAYANFCCGLFGQLAVFKTQNVLPVSLASRFRSSQSPDAHPLGVMCAQQSCPWKDVNNRVLWSEVIG